MPDIEFPTSAGTAPGYLAVPTSKSGPAKIVLQEWWGLDNHILSVCDRLATEERSCTPGVTAEETRRTDGHPSKTCLYCSLIRLHTNKVMDRAVACAILPHATTIAPGASTMNRTSAQRALR
jgi:Dienelactone hydrolase family